MSRNLVILLVVLSGGVAGLIVFSKMRSKNDVQPIANQQTIEPSASPTTQSTTVPPSPSPRITSDPAPLVSRPVVPVPAATNLSRSTVAARSTTSILTAVTNVVPELPFEVKPLPVLEKDY